VRVLTRQNGPMPKIGVIVDAGPRLGYGHVVRCVRLAKELSTSADVIFYPLSAESAEFVRNNAPEFTIGKLEPAEFPPVVITDLRELHSAARDITGSGSLHISIHDLGLGQCDSDIAIDGSIARLFPFENSAKRAVYLGPKYMITRTPVTRRKTDKFVFVTLGGGFSATFAAELAEHVARLGLEVIATRGFGPEPVHRANLTWISDERAIIAAMKQCKFAITAAGTSLYDLLASGIPTVTVGVDRIQLRTGEAFQNAGATLCAGLMQNLTAANTAEYCKELLSNRPLADRMIRAGHALVDGKGLSRVAQIVRSVGQPAESLCLTR
jgi:UDP-2,4-diacetamido-2,4,6-trideoxy-beta-L-altropyranose hydrolase